MMLDIESNKRVIHILYIKIDYDLIISVLLTGKKILS